MDCPDVTMMFVVHNAFRRDLNRMQAAAAQADDPAARTALRAGWATFSRYLTVHHTAEDEMLWPPMRTKLLDRTDETDLLVKMADEHSRLDPVLREIDDNLARGATSRLVALFDELAAVLTGHLDHEGGGGIAARAADPHQSGVEGVRRRPAPPHRHERRGVVLPLAAR
jgi:iron-sulfur cluster repair protein YtfE (RIC family)